MVGSMWRYEYQQIANDSMFPEFKPGDIVLVDNAARPRDGDFVIVVKGKARAIRHYRRLGSRTVFYPLNPLYEDTAKSRDCSIAGVVTELVRRDCRPQGGRK